MKKTLLITFLLLTPLAVHSQVTQSVQVEADGKTQYVQLADLAVTPQKPPIPALKYKLAWDFDQRTKNNAAIQYNYAMRELVQMQLRQLSDETQKFEEDYGRLFADSDYFNEKKAEYDAFEKMLENVPGDVRKNSETLHYEASLRYKPEAYRWYCNKPAAEFPVEDARKFVNEFYYAYRFLEAGSRCDYCDWEYHIRGNKNVIAILMPEVQGGRELARALMVKARLEIHDKNYDEAIKTLRVGKTLARHTGEGCPVIVGNLVGVAIDSMMNECLLELVQQPDAPNLYWTLAALPDLSFSYNKSIEIEMDFLRLMFPEVARAMDEPDEMTENDWKDMNNELTKHVLFFVRSYTPLSSFSDSGYSLNSLPFLNGLWGIAAYPKAKQWLLSEGKTAEEIENMPVAQVIGLWSIYRFEVFRDDYLKTAPLPFWQKEKFDRKDRWNEFEVVTPLDAMIQTFFPAVETYHRAMDRARASGDVLRIVEALRLYAAENDGKLPDTLDDITSVPVPPVDPFTGKPYTYHIENGCAVVEFNPGYGIYRTVIRLSF